MMLTNPATLRRWPREDTGLWRRLRKPEVRLNKQVKPPKSTQRRRPLEQRQAIEQTQLL
jgi:hypothetical protein